MNLLKNLITVAQTLHPSNPDNATYQDKFKAIEDYFEKDIFYQQAHNGVAQ
jgi:hypothetical protein